MGASQPPIDTAHPKLGLSLSDTPDGRIFVAAIMVPRPGGGDGTRRRSRSRGSAASIGAGSSASGKRRPGSRGQYQTLCRVVCCRHHYPLVFLTCRNQF